MRVYSYRSFSSSTLGESNIKRHHTKDTWQPKEHLGSRCWHLLLDDVCDCSINGLAQLLRDRSHRVDAAEAL